MSFLLSFEERPLSSVKGTWTPETRVCGLFFLCSFDVIFSDNRKLAERNEKGLLAGREGNATCHPSQGAPKSIAPPIFLKDLASDDTRYQFEVIPHNLSGSGFNKKNGIAHRGQPSAFERIILTGSPN